MTVYILDLLREQDNKKQPFEFNRFPLLLKGTDVFKAPMEVGDQPYVNPEPMYKQFRCIRRSGNWPKPLLRIPNLEHRITACLLDTLDRYMVGHSWDNIYIHMAMDEYAVTDIQCDRLVVRVLFIEGNYIKELTGADFIKIRQ